MLPGSLTVVLPIFIAQFTSSFCNGVDVPIPVFCAEVVSAWIIKTNTAGYLSMADIFLGNIKIEILN